MDSYLGQGMFQRNTYHSEIDQFRLDSYVTKEHGRQRNENEFRHEVLLLNLANQLGLLFLLRQKYL